MTSNIIELSTSSPTYFTVRKSGSLWAVQIVTSCPGKALRTTVARFSDQEEALAYGRGRAWRLHRSFKAAVRS